MVGGDTLTRTGDVVGTAAYMAPEQAEGLDASAPADLYALALVLYEALTGFNPVRAGTAAQRARRLGAHLPPLRRQRRDLPRELGRGIDLALRPKPRERGTIEEFQRALQASLQQADDTPGIVADPWRPASLRERTEHPGPQPAQADDDDPGRESEDDEEASRPWPERGLGALAAALATAWLAVHAIGPSTIAPPVAGLLAAVVVAATPHLGWLALTAALAPASLATGHTAAAMALIPLPLIPTSLLHRAPAPPGCSRPAHPRSESSGWREPGLHWRPGRGPRSDAQAQRSGVGGADPGRAGHRARAVREPPAQHESGLDLTGSAYETPHHVLAQLIADGLWAPAPIQPLCAAVALPRLVTPVAEARHRRRHAMVGAAGCRNCGRTRRGRRTKSAANADICGPRSRAAAIVALAPTVFATWRASY